MARPKASANMQKPTSQKRKASPITPIRQSKRAKPESAAPKKSVYFEQSETEPEAESAVEAEESGYEDEDASAVEPEEDEEEDEAEAEEGEEDESEEETPKRRKPKSTPKGIVIKAGKGAELWREGVKSDLKPGQEIFIKLPQARPAGKIPYTDDTIHPNTLLFLGDLKANNQRSWLKTHEADFRQAETNWKNFVESLTEKLTGFDETIPELPAKDVVFRIYRDIRFSPDPTPYKSYFSAAWSRTGRKGPYSHYYVQISPGGNSMVGGGIWMPEAPALAKIRQAIDRKSQKLKQVLLGDKIRKEFLGGVSKHEQKVIKTFTDANKDNALKRKPKVGSLCHRSPLSAGWMLI